MSQVPVPAESEVDLLLKNAGLRDDLEPYLDESVDFGYATADDSVRRE